MVLVVALHNLPKPCADLTRTMMLPGWRLTADIVTSKFSPDLADVEQRQSTPPCEMKQYCNIPNVRLILEMVNVSKAASLMGKKSAQAREKKWGKKEFVRRMQEWGKLGGRPKGTGEEQGRSRRTT